MEKYVVISAVCISAAALIWSTSRRKRNDGDLPEWIKIKSKELPRHGSSEGNYEDSMEVLDKVKVHQLRQDHCCSSQSVSYSNTDPLLIIRGEGSKLYDEKGIEYLDTRNNVGHVGHSHPKVVEAIARQACAINTNTRYLHPNHVRLAKKLLSKCPAPLQKVFFVNSGSEANDLALRLARAHTKNKQVIVVDHA